MKRILVIGNGFDLAHKLSTGYEDFLQFVIDNEKVITTIIDEYGREFVEFEDKEDGKQEPKYKLSETTREIIEVWVRDKISSFYGENEPYTVAEHPIPDDKLEDYYNAIRRLNSYTYSCCRGGDVFEENTWLKYFAEKYKELKQRGDSFNNRKIIGWAGFEEQIKEIIKRLTDNYKTRSFKGLEIIEGAADYLRSLDDDSSDELNLYEKPLEVKRRYIDVLEVDFNNLVKALEIYLAYIVPICIPKKVTIDAIKKVGADIIVNFNYTKTYQEIYGGDNVLYVHGRADEEIAGDLVFGIDEFLAEEEKDKQIDFIEYRKFYQRLYKDNDYVEMKAKLKKLPEKHIVIFYGHSMSVLDKEIIVDLLPGDNRFIKKAIICYYDKESMKRQIAELVRILGMAHLTELMTGPESKIEMV